MENIPIYLDGKIFKPSGLCLSEETTFEQWEKIGQGLQAIDLRVKWWLGDWLAFGEVTYGEMYAQALAGSHYDYKTLCNVKWVSQKVEFSRRRENLSWSHHHEVAKLEPEKQVEFLEKAEKENLTRQQLREAINQADNPPPIIKRFVLNLSSKEQYDLIGEKGRFFVTFKWDTKQIHWDMKLK